MTTFVCLHLSFGCGFAFFCRFPGSDQSIPFFRGSFVLFGRGWWFAWCWGFRGNGLISLFLLFVPFLGPLYRAFSRMSVAMYSTGISSPDSLSGSSWIDIGFFCQLGAVGGSHHLVYSKCRSVSYNFSFPRSSSHFV